MDTDVRHHMMPEHRDVFIYSALTLYGYGGSVFMVFYGLATALRGYLVYRSSFFPAWLGGLLVLAGIGFIVKNLVTVLTPQLDSELLLAPVFLAMASLAGWLLMKGVDATQWQPCRQARPEP